MIDAYIQHTLCRSRRARGTCLRRFANPRVRCSRSHSIAHHEDETDAKRRTTLRVCSAGQRPSYLGESKGLGAGKKVDVGRGVHRLLRVINDVERRVGANHRVREGPVELLHGVDARNLLPGQLDFERLDVVFQVLLKSAASVKIQSM